MAATKYYVFSDVHIGDDSATNWYQSSFHGPFLRAAVEHVLAQDASVRGVQFAGDLFDQWAYTSDVDTPSVDRIVSVQQSVFGPDGLIGSLLDAPIDAVTWVPGNHDLSVQEAEVNRIVGRSGRRLVVGNPDDLPGFHSEHGNAYSFFNRPDAFHLGRLAPPLDTLPFGHFMTRAISDRAQKLIAKERRPTTYADLDPSPEESLKAVFTGMVERVFEDVKDGQWVDVLDCLLAALAAFLTTELDEVRVGGNTWTYAHVCFNYAPTLPKWYEQYGVDRLALCLAEDLLSDLHWARGELDKDKVVLFGHTHYAALEPDRFQPYFNNGYFCPTKAEVARGVLPTFTEVTLEDGQAPTVQILEVTPGPDYRVQPWSRKALLPSPKPDPTLRERLTRHLHRICRPASGKSR